MAETVARPMGWLNRLSPQAVFVLIAGIFGLALAVITPPIEVPDELPHWYRVYQLSQGQMLSTNYGGDVPNSMSTFGDQPWYGVRFHPEVKTRPQQIFDAFRVPLHPEKTHFEVFQSPAIYSLVPYAPQTLAMLIARKMDAAPIALLYIGRIGTVLGYVLIGWLAIRITPILKWPACMVMTNPMALFLAGSLSADPVTLALYILLTAILLRCIYSASALSSGTIAWLAVATVAASLCKPVYIPVVLLVLAVPRDKWGGGHRRWAIPALIILLSIVTVAVWAIVAKTGQITESGDRPVDQLQWVLHHPLEYFNVVHRTLSIHWEVYVNSTVGLLGWVDTPLLPSVIDFIYIAFFWILLAYDEPLELRFLPRLLAGVALVITIGFIITSNYMIWMKVGASTVEGLQGRYLLPCALLLGLVVRRRGAHPAQAKWMLALMGTLSLYTVWVVLERYYLPAGFLGNLISKS